MLQVGARNGFKRWICFYLKLFDWSNSHRITVPWVEEAISKTGEVFITGGKEIRETTSERSSNGEYTSFHSGSSKAFFLPRQQCFNRIFTIGANAAASRAVSQSLHLGRLFVSSGGNYRLFDLITQHRSCRRLLLLLLLLLRLCRSIALSSLWSDKKEKVLQAGSGPGLSFGHHTVNSGITWQREPFSPPVMWLTSLSTVWSAPLYLLSIYAPSRQQLPAAGPDVCPNWTEIPLARQIVLQLPRWLNAGMCLWARWRIDAQARAAWKERRSGPPASSALWDGNESLFSGLPVMRVHEMAPTASQRPQFVTSRGLQGNVSHIYWLTTS